jgi:uncharacterized membrane protein
VEPAAAGAGPQYRAPYQAGGDLFASITPRTASLLCYLPMVGWLAAIIALSSARFRDDAKVRFNAFQGLYLFVAWLIVDWVLTPVFHVQFLRVLLKGAVFVGWIFMIIKASHDEQFKLPILGDLAEKSLIEQR